MKRILTLTVILLMVTAAYAQKQTTYLFKYKIIMEMESDRTIPCDFELTLSDIPGVSPVMTCTNHQTHESTVQDLNNVIVYNPEQGMIYFGNAKGDEVYGTTIVTGNDGSKASVFIYFDNKFNEIKKHYVLINESDSPNNELSKQTFNALLKNVKTNSFNNYTVIKSNP